MSWLIASNLGLLAAVLTLGVVVASLARQIGVLHERTAPGGAALQRARQAQPLDPDALRVSDLTGITRSLASFAGGQPLGILFVGPDCPVCKALLPGFEPAIGHLDLLACYAGGAGPQEVQAKYAAEYGLDPARYLVGNELALALQVMQTPTLVVVDGNGQVLLREILRSPAHLAAAAARLNSRRRPDGSLQP